MSDLQIDDLKREIAKGRAVFIVGGAVSFWSTKAPITSWRRLLQDGAERCVRNNPSLKEDWFPHVKEALSAEQPEWRVAAAGIVKSQFSPADYAAWLRDSFGNLEVKRREMLEAIRSLSTAIVTTNYDGVIEKAFDWEPVTWQDSERLAAIVRGEQPGVVHLHGYYARPETVLLGVQDYAKALDEDAQNAIRTLFLNRTAIFVGYGNGRDDPNFRMLLKWIEPMLNESPVRHYRLALEGDCESLQANSRLVLVSYGSKPDQLLDFLQSLVLAPGAAMDLPPRPAVFDRDRTLDRIAGHLLAEEQLPALICGPAGIGKSSVLLAAMHDERVARRFGARRYYIRCDGARSASELAGWIATALELPLTNTADKGVLEALGAELVLLGIDETEAMFSADPAGVGKLLRELGSVPGVSLLVAVREADDAETAPLCFRLEPLSPEGAVEAFVAVAGARFATDPDLKGLLKSTSHIPLAIDLLGRVAAQEYALEPVLIRWQRMRSVLQRRQTEDVQPTDIAYELALGGESMTADALRLLSVLAALPNGVRQQDLPEVMESGVAAAVNLRKSGLAADEKGRIRLLAPTREYMTRCHAAEPADLTTASRFYLRVAGDLAAKLGGDNDPEVRRRLLAEAANIEDMILAGLAADDGATLDASVAWIACQTAGFGTDRPFRIAADLARRLQSWLHLGCLSETLAKASMHGVDQAATTGLYREALDAYRRSGDPLGQANCMRALADIAHADSDDLPASRLYQDALTIYRDAGNEPGQAACLRGLGNIAARRGENERAGEMLDNAVQFYRTSGDVATLAKSLMRLGEVAFATFEQDRAREVWEEALPLLRQMEDAAGEAACLMKLGDMARARSQATWARGLYQRALVLYTSLDEKQSIGTAHRALALVARNDQERLEHLEAARQIWSDLNLTHLLLSLDLEFGT